MPTTKPVKGILNGKTLLINRDFLPGKQISLIKDHWINRYKMKTRADKHAEVNCVNESFKIYKRKNIGHVPGH